MLDNKGLDVQLNTNKEALMSPAFCPPLVVSTVAKAGTSESKQAKISPLQFRGFSHSPMATACFVTSPSLKPSLPGGPYGPHHYANTPMSPIPPKRAVR